MLIIYFLLLLSILARKWDPVDLAKQVSSWNYLNDPEELIQDKSLGPKINTNYLKVNHVYDKTDVNYFIISDVIEKYAYNKQNFVQDLYKSMEILETIDTTNKKEHHLIIVLLIKKKELLFYGSSDKLRKLLPKDKLIQISHDVKQSIDAKQYAQCVYFTFEKLHLMWKKFSVKSKTSGKGYQPKGSSSTMELIYFLGSCGVLGFFAFAFCYKRNKDKKE